MLTWYFGKFWNAWPSPSKSYYQFVENFKAYLHAEDQLHQALFLKILQKIAYLIFWVIWAYLATHTPKIILSIWKNLWHLSAGKISTSSFLFSLRYSKDIANLLFWELWSCVAKHTQLYYQLVENFCAYLQAKNQHHPQCFSGDIAKIYKLLILGTLGMSGHAYPN